MPTILMSSQIRHEANNPGIEAPISTNRLNLIHSSNSYTTPHPENNHGTSSTVNKFKLAAKFVASLTATRGLQGVDEKARLEVRDPRHRRWESVGSAKQNTGAYALWHAQNDNKHVNLFDWMDQNQDLAVTLERSKSKQKIGEASQVTYLTKKLDINQLRVEIKDGKWLRVDNTFVDTSQSPGKKEYPGYGVIVVHANKLIYVHDYEVGKQHHTTTTGGRPVLISGIIKIKNGVATSFALISGHYPCSAESLTSFLKFIKDKINLGTMTIEAPFLNKDTLDQIRSDFGIPLHSK